MTLSRMTAIAFIYAVATIAWFVLGLSVHERSGEFDQRLSQEVARLWGGRHSQAAPQLWVERPKTVTENVERTTADGRKVTDVVSREVVDRLPVAMDATRVDVALDLDHQKKGLLWYDTYGVTVRATYRARSIEVPHDRVFRSAYWLFCQTTGGGQTASSICSGPTW